jgi:hypothetical protein
MTSDFKEDSDKQMNEVRKSVQNLDQKFSHVDEKI